MIVVSLFDDAEIIQERMVSLGNLNLENYQILSTILESCVMRDLEAELLPLLFLAEVQAKNCN